MSFCFSDCPFPPLFFLFTDRSVCLCLSLILPRCLLCGVCRASELELQAHLQHLAKLCSLAIHDVPDAPVLTPQHEDFFLNDALPQLVRSLLHRVYLFKDLEVQWVHEFFRHVIKLIIVNFAASESPWSYGAVDTLFRLFDDSRRYYVTYGDTPVAPTPTHAAAPDVPITKPDGITPPLLLDIVNYFGIMGGFEAFYTRLDAWTADWSDEENGDASLAELETLSLPFVHVYGVFARPIQAAFAEKVCMRCLVKRLFPPPPALP